MTTPIDDLKRRIDIHDLAARLGLTRPDPNGNYRSPHHPDKSPSVQVGGRKYPDGWYDHSAGQGGDAIDLVVYVQGGTIGEAIAWIRDQYGFPDDRPPRGEPRPATLVEHIAAQSLTNPAPAMEYLAGRGILPVVIDRAVKLKTVGFNAWCSARKPPGSVGHGGPATAFLVRSLNPGKLVAVDLRYHDPALNGGQKSGSQGEKRGYPWISDARALNRAHTVVVVESPINALSAESAFAAGRLGGWAALALRGVANAEALDLLPLRGKRVVLCLDNDPPAADGRRPGPEAAWTLHLRLTAAKIAAHLIDQADWECNDLNDALQADGAEATAKILQRFQPWAIPGLSGHVEPGRKRLFLPAADFAIYDHFRVREDFTTYFTRDQDREGNETSKHADLAGFRIADIAKIDIASAMSALTGEPDHQPRTLFAVSAQSPFYGNDLTRHVTTFERMHKPDWWARVGPIWLPQQFLRLISLWGRAVSLGKRDAVNFVGLCWKAGKLHVNEGPDTYFTEPEKQCPYHNLRFPGGTPTDAAKVIRAYATTYSHQSALFLLTWALGAHLKAILAFWPHLALQADKGKGKTTLCERLTRTIACTLFSGDSLETGFRLVTSTSHTSHPVIWEEISARRQEIIDRAVSTLQEAYKYTISRRTSEQTEYVKCAPVLLMGEAVEEPVRSIIGKSVRVQLRDKGPLLPADLPPFPVRPWLDFLAALPPQQTRSLHQQAIEFCRARCRAGGADEGASRMVENYAAVLAAWRLLQEFAGIALDEIPLTGALLQEMNSHIAETQASRQPWVWVVEIVLNEIAAGAYPFPYRFGEMDSQEVFFLRPSQMVHHLKTKPGLRAIWDGLPVKSDRVLKKQMRAAGVLVAERTSPTISGQQQSHMVALSLTKLAEYGLFPEEPNQHQH